MLRLISKNCSPMPLSSEIPKYQNQNMQIPAQNPDERDRSLLTYRPFGVLTKARSACLAASDVVAAVEEKARLIQLRLRCASPRPRRACGGAPAERGRGPQSDGASATGTPERCQDLRRPPPHVRVSLCVFLDPPPFTLYFLFPSGHYIA